MADISPAQIAAVLWQVGLRRSAALVNLTAIALAESGGEVDAVRGARRGLWLINDSRGFDRRKMVTDAAYAAARAVEISRKGDTLSMWPTWNNGQYKRFLNVAQQAEARAAAVSGSVLAEDGSYVPANYWDANPATGSSGPGRPLPPPAIGGGAPITASFERQEPLQGLRITGTELTGDFSSIVIGDPEYNASMTEIPNLGFTVADPQGDLLWQKRNIWQKGNRVQYLDLDMRLDSITFAPGGHGTGQLELTCIDSMVYDLMHLRGARVQKNCSPTDFIAGELRLAGYDPARYFLGERLPVAQQVARDVPDEQQAGSDTDNPPSAWTTIVRLAKEAGRRVYISGRKLVFGSVTFSRQFAAPGDLRIGWHGAPPGEQWMSLPSASNNSSGSTAGGTEVTGRVPLNRARFFRPGVSVIVYRTPSVAAGDRRMICSKVAHTLSRDIDGAEVTLIDPVDPKAEKS